MDKQHDHTLTPARTMALAASRLYRLPFGRHAWKGTQGNWAGTGTGSSIDFQDHRDYQWGDDPRNIHWAAYARTGQLTMKLYRSELSPVVDIVVDISPSMSVTPQKTQLTDALLLYSLYSADHAASPVRIHAVNGKTIRRIETDDVRAGTWRERLGTITPDPSIPQITSWGANCLKILISDLLYPGNPETLLSPIIQKGGLPLIFAPYAPEETDLPQSGNVRLTDCETGETRHQYLSESIVKRYRRAYQTHLTLWKEASRRYNILMARVPADKPLADGLAVEALKEGLVELY